MTATAIAQDEDEVRPRAKLPRLLIGVAAVVMLGGLLFGDDQGVIGGALDGIENSFDIGTLAIEIITSWVTLGALVGEQFFLSLTDAIGESGTFYLFAFMCVVSFAFIWFKQPETKGRSLAEIQEMWEREAARAGRGE